MRLSTGFHKYDDISESRERVSTTCGSGWVNGDATQSEKLTPATAGGTDMLARFPICHRTYEILYLDKSPEIPKKLHMTRVRFTILLLLLVSVPLTVTAQNLNEDLLAATRKSDLAKVKALLDQGADVNAKSNYGATPLFFACDRGNVEIVKLLLERGADVNVKDTFYAATPLGWALGKTNPEVIRLLIEKGAKETQQALTFAINGGHVAVAKAALDAGRFDPEALNRALRSALGKNNQEIVALLKAAGAKELPVFNVPPEVLKGYEGTYRSPAVVMVFAVKDGKLIATVNSADNTMVALSQHTFEIDGAGGVTVVFTLEGEKVTGLNLTTPGGKFALTKEVK